MVLTRALCPSLVPGSAKSASALATFHTKIPVIIWHVSAPGRQTPPQPRRLPGARGGGHAARRWRTRRRSERRRGWRRCARRARRRRCGGGGCRRRPRCAAECAGGRADVLRLWQGPRQTRAGLPHGKKDAQDRTRALRAQQAQAGGAGEAPARTGRPGARAREYGCAPARHAAKHAGTTPAAPSRPRLTPSLHNFARLSDNFPVGTGAQPRDGARGGAHPGRSGSSSPRFFEGYAPPRHPRPLSPPPGYLPHELSVFLSP